MQAQRSITPLPQLKFNTSEYLNEREFPRYNIQGQLNCPPAPPRNNQEIRICSCTKTYQIEFKQAPLKKCGYCTRN